MKRIVANTPAQKKKGLTGAPKGSTGLFNYMTAEPRTFKYTDRDLDVYADGVKVGSLTKDNPTVKVPPATEIEERPMKCGGKVHMQDGGPINTSGPRADKEEEVDYTVVGKTKIAQESHFGNNPAINRMIVPGKTYDFEDGNKGTHYMSSVDNYAVPLLQDKGGENLEYMGDNPPPSNEDIKFDSPEQAKWFAENYKKFAPMMKNYPKGLKKGGSTKSLYGMLCR